jgi:predicted nucleotidyltransferase
VFATVEVVIEEHVIQDAAQRLVNAASAPARVILFGSAAAGVGGADSDLDFLVIERDCSDRFAETVRLRRALRPLRVPVDVVVVTEQHVQEWGEVPNTMLQAALSAGRVLAEA